MSPAIKRLIHLSCSNTGSTKKFFLGDKRNRKFVSYLSCSDAVGHLHYVLLLASPALHPTAALTSHSPVGKL